VNRARVLQAAAITAAIALQVHRDRHLRNEARIHEGDLEVHQVEIDRLNRRCGITDEVRPRVDAGVITAAERIAADRAMDTLAARDYTPAERRRMAELESFFADEEVQW
jgi:hypothetical protein